MDILHYVTNQEKMIKVRFEPKTVIFSFVFSVQFFWKKKYDFEILQSLTTFQLNSP